MYTYRQLVAKDDTVGNTRTNVRKTTRRCSRCHTHKQDTYSALKILHAHVQQLQQRSTSGEGAAVAPNSCLTLSNCNGMV